MFQQRTLNVDKIDKSCSSFGYPGRDERTPNILRGKREIDDFEVVTWLYLSEFKPQFECHIWGETQKFTRRQWAGTMSLVNCAPLPYPTGRGAILLLHCSKGTFFCIPPDPFLPDSEQCAILFSPSPLLYIDISWHLFMSYSSHPYSVPCSTPWRPFNDSECDTLSCLSTNPKCHASSYDPPVSPWSIFSFLCSRTFFFVFLLHF